MDSWRHHFWETPQPLSRHQQGDKVVQETVEHTLTSPSLLNSQTVTKKILIQRQKHNIMIVVYCSVCVPEVASCVLVHLAA